MTERGKAWWSGATDRIITPKSIHRKLIVPYKFPLVMGNEFCGIIEKTGANVKGFEVGDRVYARMPLAKIGAFAEYTAIDYRAVVNYYFLLKLRTSKITVHLENSIVSAAKVTKSSSF